MCSRHRSKMKVAPMETRIITQHGKQQFGGPRKHEQPSVEAPPDPPPNRPVVKGTVLEPARQNQMFVFEIFWMWACNTSILQIAWMDARMFLDPRIQNPRQTYLSDLYRKRRAVYSYQPLKNSEWTAVPPQKGYGLLSCLVPNELWNFVLPGWVTCGVFPSKHLWEFHASTPNVSNEKSHLFGNQVGMEKMTRNNGRAWIAAAIFGPSAFKTRGRQWWKGMFASCFHPHFDIVSIFTSKTMIEKMSWQINFLWWLHDKCANPTQGEW